MAYELIYTSLPSGIMAGRSGFCVAAYTENMPERLVLMVEKFSNFDHCGVSEKYSLNKLCHSNIDYYVLTRSADCGKDYTGRTNFISHHLVLSANEIAKYPNPADILLQYNWLNSYTKAPQKIKEPPDLSKISFEKHVPCKTWGEIFKDAGVAAFPRIKDDCEIYASRQFPQKTILRLFAESLALTVNGKSAWSYTFTTALGSSEVALSYKWKVSVNRSKDSRNPNAIDLDLQKAPSFAECRLSEYARSGVLTKAEALSLTAAKPKKANTKFTVVNTKPERTFQPIYVYSVVIAILCSLIVVLAFSLLGGNNADEYEDYPEYGGESFAQIAKRIDNAIARNDYSSATAIWFGYENREIRKDYISFINSKIRNSIAENLRDFENTLNSSDTISQKQVEKMAKACSNAEKYLEKSDFPDKKSLLKRTKRLLEQLSKE